MIKHEIFPITIWEYQYDSAESLSQKVVPMFNDIEKNNPNDINYPLEGYTSYGVIPNILDYDEMVELKQFILKSVIESLKDLGIPGYAEMTGSWFNINRKYSSHGPHNHVPDTLSGIYYVKANEDDANITFHDQNKISNWPWKPSTKKDSRCFSSANFKPKTGRLYVFPSYAQHSVEQQIEDSSRVSISFNVFVK